MLLAGSADPARRFSPWSRHVLRARARFRAAKVRCRWSADHRHQRPPTCSETAEISLMLAPPAGSNRHWRSEFLHRCAESIGQVWWRLERFLRETFRSAPIAARTVALAVALTAALVAGCTPGGDDGNPTTTFADRPSGTAVPAVPAVLGEIISGRPAPATDTFEVWVCMVPSDNVDPLYDASGARLVLTPLDVVRRIGGPVGSFYAHISHGAYRPDFTVGGTVAISSTDTSQRCIDSAIARSDRTDGADAVLVVANAQHAADQPGGRSTPGGWLTCTDDCSAATTGRSVYVGANDFHPALTGGMPFDLIEHELGHSLGLPHSGGMLGTEGNRGVGPYDMMADPASPRAIDPSRRDAPDTIAINRLDLGWMPMEAVHIVEVDARSGTPDRVQLSPSTGSTGTRVALVVIDDHHMLSVELLADTGFDDHLPRTGVVVHVVNDSPEQCGTTTRCADLQRVQQIVGGDAANAGNAVDRTLLGGGDTVTWADWRLSIDTVHDDMAWITVGRSVDGT